MNSTSIGKWLVMVVTAVSLMFLGISTVAYSTARDWLNETKDEQNRIGELKKKLAEATDIADKAKKALEDAKQGFDIQAKQIAGRLAAVEEENKRDLRQIVETHTQIEKAQGTARTTLEQVEAKRKATDVLLAEKKAVQEQASAYKLHEGELVDRVREVERMLETVSKNSASLKDRVGP